MTLSIRPTEVQKVAGVALLTTYQQKTNYNPPNSFSTTEPSLSAPQMTIDALHVPSIRHMWLFQRRHGVISVPGTSAHSYSGFSVLSTAHLYGKCCVPLFCSVGGFCPFVWKRHQTGPEGHMMAWTWLRWLFFVLLHCHYPCLSFFSCFLLMENFIIRQTKENWHRCPHFFGQMLTNVSTVCWWLQVKFKVLSLTFVLTVGHAGFQRFLQNTWFLAHPMYVWGVKTNMLLCVCIVAYHFNAK